MIIIILCLQVLGDVCSQEVRQDDEVIQRRQGLQEEQQMRIVLNSRIINYATNIQPIIKLKCKDKIKKTRQSIIHKTSEISKLPKL